MEPRILVVDDDEISRTLIVERLKGCFLDVACSGNEALEMINTHEYALVILDIQMPEVDGFQVARHIKSLDKNKDTPIIFLSASSSDRLIKEGYRSGAVDYIKKGGLPDDFKERVKSYCSDYVSKVNKRVANKKAIEKQSFQELIDLSHSVPHDLNNIVTPVYGNAMLIKLALKEEEIDKGYIDELLDEITVSAKRITKVSKAFSNFLDQDFNYEKVDINSVIGSLVVNEYTNIMEVIFRLEKKIWVVNSNRNKISEIIAGAVNTLDSKNICIRTNNVFIDQKNKEVISNSISGEFVRIEIGDVVEDEKERYECKSFSDISDYESTGITTQMRFMVGTIKRLNGWINFRQSLKTKKFSTELFIPAIKSKKDKMNCWRFKRCGLELGGENVAKYGVCPVSVTEKNDGIYGGELAGRSCWSIDGTLCDCGKYSNKKEKTKACLECDFFKKVQNEEGIKDIDEITSILSDK